MQQASDNIDFGVLRGLANSLVAAKKPDQVFKQDYDDDTLHRTCLSLTLVLTTSYK